MRVIEIRRAAAIMRAAFCTTRRFFRKFKVTFAKDTTISPLHPSQKPIASEWWGYISALPNFRLDVDDVRIRRYSHELVVVESYVVHIYINVYVPQCVKYNFDPKRAKNNKSSVMVRFDAHTHTHTHTFTHWNTALLRQPTVPREGEKISVTQSP